jgi:hypothetical protein
MPGLGGCWSDRAATWNALVRWQSGTALDIIGQELKSVLRVRLDQLKLRESRRRALYVSM